MCEMLLSCRFSQQPCSCTDFEWVYNSFYGNCFVFNSGRNSSGGLIPLKKNKEAGAFAGLYLELFTSMTAELAKFSSKVSGFRIYMGNNSARRLMEVQQEILVSTGAVTDIAVQRTFVSQMEKPYSECEHSSDSLFYKRLVNANFSYTRSDCLTLCRQEYIENNCRCYDGRFLSVNLNRVCATIDEINCANEYVFKFGLTDLSRECNEQCPLECDKTLFSTLYSQANVLLKEKFKLYSKNKVVRAFFSGKNVSLEEFTQGFASMFIFYDRMGFTLVSEKEAFSLVDLVSNVGGTFGLFVGVSILSLFEIFEIVFEIIFFYKDRKNLVENY